MSLLPSRQCIFPAGFRVKVKHGRIGARMDAWLAETIARKVNSMTEQCAAPDWASLPVRLL